MNSTVTLTLERLDGDLRDLYPKPGTRIKQWVVDTRARAQWCADTCPTIHVAGHLDNTDAPCRNVGRAPWFHLDHDCCDWCNDLRDDHSGDLDVAAWQMARALLPPICEDHDKLSDEMAPGLDLAALDRMCRVVTGKDGR